MISYSTCSFTRLMHLSVTCLMADERASGCMQVRREGESMLGTKVEVKNMNSFSAMQRAIEFEVSRQVRLLPMCMHVNLPKTVADVTGGLSHRWRSTSMGKVLRLFRRPGCMMRAKQRPSQ